MNGDRLIWEESLQKHFEIFLQKMEMVEVPDVYTLTFLKAEIEKMENSVAGWVDLSQKLSMPR